MNSKILGGILLVVGTTIGGGILALPIATAQLGFIGSVVLLVACWAVMTMCAFLFLEVNLWLPANSNLISMAGATLGKPGQAVVWCVYLLLLYCGLSAYIAGGSDLFHYILSASGWQVSSHATAVLFTALLGAIVYCGIRSVDYVNRGLMGGKLGALIILVLLLAPFVSINHLGNGELKYLIAPTSLTITVVSFACLMIIPSLRTYFNDDVKTLRRVIFIGTFIPLLCYIAWDMVIMGVIPLEGSSGLKGMLKSSSSTSDLIAALQGLLNSQTVNTLAKFFTSICVTTSFLSISLCLSDFLADGFKVTKEGKGGILVFGATFLPPLLVVLFYPGAFIRGLNYVGLSCFVLMILLPPLMVWRGRYHKIVASASALATSATYQVKIGKFLLALLMIFATLMIGFGIEGAV